MTSPNYLPIQLNKSTGTLIASNTFPDLTIIFTDGSTTPIYTVTGSPIVTTGTITLTLHTQNQNLVFAGPVTGSAAQPGFRNLVTADLPLTAVTPSNYTLTALSVDATGRIIFAANGTSSHVTTALGYTPLNKAGDTMSGALTMGGFAIHNLATPSVSTDAATKGYVDSTAVGITVLQAVNAASTANINISNPGTAIFDGVTLSNGNRLLVKNQGTGNQNGIYQFNGSSSALTRTSDFNSGTTFSGDIVFVSAGTANGGTTWIVTTPNPITLGTTSITWTEFSATLSYVAGTGLSLTGSTFANTGVLSIVAGTGISISGGTGNVTVNNTGVTSIAITGSDFTISGSPITTSGTISLTLATVNATTGSFGDGSHVASVNVNGKGLVTAVTSVAIAIPYTAVSGLATSATTDTTNATNITSGTLNSSRISGAYTGITQVGTLTAGVWNGTAIAVGYGGTGVTTTPANGQILVGNGTNYTVASVAAGTGITTTVGAGTLQINNAGVTSLTGTAGQINVSTTTGAVTLTIDSSYIGQSSITTLGTISTGTWHGSVVASQYGGTGINNGTSTITIGGNLTFSGAFTTAFTVTGNTSVVLPTTGTLVNSSVTTLSSLVSVGTITTGVWASSTPVGPQYGGTGINNGTSTITIGGNVLFNGSFGTTFQITGPTNVTFPTSGTLLTSASAVTSIGLADNSTTPIYSISGSPITTSGTLALTLATQTANLVFAGPASGSAAQPGFRSLVAADMPAFTGAVTTSAGSTVTTIPAGTITDAMGQLENKPSVGLIAASNITLTGAQTIDGVLGTAGTTLVLATAQSTASQNGPWIMQVGSWSRPTWYASGNTTQAQQFIVIRARLGNTYSGSFWRMTTASPITIDTTATAWAQVAYALSTTSVSGFLPAVNQSTPDPIAVSFFGGV